MLYVATGKLQRRAFWLIAEEAVMGTKKIYVDDHNRELSAHGTETFPVTVNHDDLWMFEGRNVPIHWHNEIEFCLPRKGTAVCQIYQESYTIPAGSAILIGSNVPHSCHSLTGESVLYSSIIAAPEFISGEIGGDVERKCMRPFLEGSAGPCIRIDGTGADRTEADRTEVDRTGADRTEADRTGAESRRLLQMLDEIDRLYTEKPLCHELRIKGLLCEILAALLSEAYRNPANKRLQSVPASSAELERLQLTLDYLHQHYDSVVSLQELSDLTHLSREACCRSFRRMTGKSITEYLQEYRVTQSLPLIRSGRYSISQVAELCGFSNASRFAAAFRKRMGINPGHYLKEGCV